jgi:hypothetical protein
MPSMIQTAILSALCGYFIVVWLNTDALFEYLNLLKLTIGKKIAEYKKLKLLDYPGNYANFLREYYHDKFIVRLITCPICVSFWLGLAVICCLGSFESICAPALILFFYLLFNKML